VAEVEARHLQVIFLAEQQNPDQPRVVPPKLEQPPVQVVLPQIDMPVIDIPDSRALTVAHTPAPPSPPPAAPAIDPGVPVAVDTVDFLRRDKPRYPPEAKRARAQGIVYLQVIIDPEGKPREVVVHRSSGFAQLDAAAREAVLGWLFKPYRENGIARSARAIVPVQFGLMASGGMPRDRRGDHRDDHGDPAFAGADGH
jgi:protein TonB